MSIAGHLFMRLANRALDWLKAARHDAQAVAADRRARRSFHDSRDGRGGS